MLLTCRAHRYSLPGVDDPHTLTESLFGATSTRRDPRVNSQDLDQVIDFSGRDTVDISLHDHCITGLVNATPAFEHRGEEAAFP